jgi:hypothetical protein
VTLFASENFLSVLSSGDVFGCSVDDGCSYLFSVQGACVNPSCAYRHVKVNRQAQMCPVFLRTGTCDKGANCPLKHPARISRAPIMASAASTAAFIQLSEPTPAATAHMMNGPFGENLVSVDVCLPPAPPPTSLLASSSFISSFSKERRER